MPIAARPILAVVFHRYMVLLFIISLILPRKTSQRSIQPPWSPGPVGSLDANRGIRAKQQGWPNHCVLRPKEKKRKEDKKERKRKEKRGKKKRVLCLI